MKRLVTLFALMSLLVGSSCTGRSRTEVDVEAAIRENVEDRLQFYRERHRANCLQEALEIASAEADSILLARARSERSGSQRPGRPNRPAVPTPKTLSDSLLLRPLFRDAVLPDTSG